ncbi:30S ribosomal protein S2 [Candidatus Micrarchaeota archaeon]|nr:30S ribosomal protein S2 [Candidatus Micrarchaeota archaeon]
MDLLIPQEKYLGAGVHIGTRNKSGGMREYIYKVREDGLHVLDLKKMDGRIRAAAKLLAKFPDEKVYLVSNKENAKSPLAKMGELTGFNALIGRFTPGRFTNPRRADFIEPGIIIVVDPNADRQAVKEAYDINVPVIALCDTNNQTKFVDVVIPTNNKGRKAITMVIWLLSREVMKLKGKISSYEEFTFTPEEFEAV